MEEKIKGCFEKFKNHMTEKTVVAGPRWLLDYVVPYCFGAGITIIGISIASWITGIRYAPYSIRGIRTE